MKINCYRGGDIMERPEILCVNNVTQGSNTSACTCCGGNGK